MTSPDDSQGIAIRQEKDGTVIIDCVVEEHRFDSCASNLRQRLQTINGRFSIDRNSTDGLPFKPWFTAQLTTIKANDDCTLCLCGHRIREVHVLRQNDCVISLGSRCIEKFFSPLSDDAKQNIRLLNRKTSDCERCGHYRITKGDVKTCHCFRFKSCLQCGKVLMSTGKRKRHKGAGAYCFDCETKQSCNKCSRLFGVKTHMKWWVTLCPSCNGEQLQAVESSVVSVGLSSSS